MAVSGSSFKPGKSGNPGGRPKQPIGAPDVVKLAQAWTEQAIAGLSEIAQDDKLPPGPRVAAWLGLLARGHGAPTQPTQQLGADGKPVDPTPPLVLIDVQGLGKEWKAKPK